MNKILPIAVAGLVGLTLCGCKVQYASTIETNEEGSQEVTVAPEKTIYFRYNDSKYTEFFDYCANSFMQENKNVKVVLELKDKENYVIDIINNTTNSKGPDVYFTETSALGTLTLSGVADVNNASDVSDMDFGQGALNACTYEGKIVAYPFDFSVPFLVYNTDFLTVENVSTFDDIKNFADEADFGDLGVQLNGVFTCNLSKLFMNYGFIGSGISLGGDCGDKADDFIICSEASLSAVNAYKDLVNFFNIGSDLKYEKCVEYFMNTEFLATIVTPDTLKQLDESEINYGIAPLPDYGEGGLTKPLSITNAIVVNPFSAQTDVAAEFAEYVTITKANQLYEYTERISACQNVNYENDYWSKIYDSYNKSVSKNKLQYGEQVYALLEIALHNIVAGNDVTEELTVVQEYMDKQLR